MEKKFEEDDELKNLLEEQYIKEAEALEAALFSDGEFEDYEASDEEVLASYDKLVARLKAEGIYREDEDSTPADSGPSEAVEEKIIPMPSPAVIGTPKKAGRRYRFVKAAGFGVVGMLCVFAASMTSEANRTYFVNNVRYLAGDDTRIVIDNDDTNEVDMDEYQAIEDIKSKLKIEIPEFLYRPLHFDFFNYNVDFYSGIAVIEYVYDENIVAFSIDKENENSASMIDSAHGDSLKSVEITDENIKVVIKMIQDDQDIKPSYSARWEKDNVIYTVIGKIDLEELEEILKNLKY